MDQACTAKTFLSAKLKNLMTVRVLKEIYKTFQIAIALHQHHQINKPFKKSPTPKNKNPKAI